MGGGYGFFLKNILILNVAEKNILILVEEKKIIWFRVFVIYPNVEFWKKISHFTRQKNKYSNSHVVRKNILNETKKP